METIPVGVLARSKCFYLAAPITEAPWKGDDEVGEILQGLLEGRYSIDSLNISVLKKVLLVSTLYGGLTLVYTCNPVVPISRVHVDVGISIQGGGHYRQLDDEELMKSWALIVSGKEEEGLSMISGGFVYPEGYTWSVGGRYKVAVRGIKYRV
ncbi:MAG: hypothetical protein G5Z42_06560 [Caldisphaeraceae archaeon]|nr:hypothetical protein [Caldisphaeraceae archaeon]MEB3691934.1 hypothetical protein [Caldisphaeraceae archaeon]MEB3798460.1 hypothetical protein [Caldisphaeraceae archaeon]